ncbi:flagellar basal-body rod protein FlgF [Buchnera aphidicola (Macrosiphoniella sanborni)]|uniref:Flagellar basal-body rod protein FlgF n=1 Tax=Buchnera aphidicola (Macrosiphoniella sanborni) TaxID=1241865 RepID=A0A4D6YD46_9GAMM|nr:flagellar basal-body rod protein FlgF [Buchnera aphidicola]QCI23874.1 flagellar basal-body rod protein FlgF [Buchnera aphidicola (Macrosiphoniella sanborni)]
MDSSIYESMTAANQLLEKQSVISNNLANISTTGFKEKFIFTVKNQNNNYKNIIKEYYNIFPGKLNYTDRNLDVFIKDNDGWLVVRDIHGQEGYTKNGHLKINANSQLTIQNHEVVGNNCNIKIPHDLNIKILSNGLIKSIKQYNNQIIENTIGALKLVKLPSNVLIHKENGLFYFKNSSQKNKYNNLINHNNHIRLQSGMLEESNVNAVQNMIEMISNSRQFDMQIKMISTYDRNSEYANQLININN